MRYYETANYGKDNNRQCSRCGDTILSGEPYMQSDEGDTVCRDCYYNKRKVVEQPENEEDEGEVTERKKGFWAGLGFVPKERVVTVEQQRQISGLPRPEEVERPRASAIPYSFDLSEELDSIERECDDAEQQGIGMRKVVERLRLKLGIPSKAVKRQKQVLRE